MNRLIVCSAAFLFSLNVAVAAGPITGVASVVDGDTLEVHGVRIRLHGVDAPESSQLCQREGKTWRCGQAAAKALSDLIGRRTVSCEPLKTDRYGRTVARCAVGGEDVEAWMVTNGWAVAYRHYSQDYVPQEGIAKKAKAGIWASDFQMPWDWRERAGAASDSSSMVMTNTSAAGCFVKGNISSKGERIYHVPGGRWYEKTQIETTKGERMFCSEHEASAAGWRKSGQ